MKQNNVQVNGIFGTSETPIEFILTGMKFNTHKEIKDLYKTYKSFMERDLGYTVEDNYTILPFSEFKKYARVNQYRSTSEFISNLGLLTMYENGESHTFNDLMENFESRLNRNLFGYFHLNFAYEVVGEEEFKELNFDVKLDSIKLDSNLDLIQVEFSLAEADNIEIFNGKNIKRTFNIFNDFNKSIIDAITPYSYAEKKRYRYIDGLYKYLNRIRPVWTVPTKIPFDKLCQKYEYFTIFITDQFGNRFNIHPRTSIKSYNDFNALFHQTITLGSFTSMDMQLINLLTQSYKVNQRDRYLNVKDNCENFLNTSISSIFGESMEDLNIRLLEDESSNDTEEEEESGDNGEN